ncbi:MAG TPA: hypothetical protein VFP63_06350 [Dehalococcoidia bacterium]|nr:hypothetical protein [Dehalococcoidia bacterium]
MLGEARLNVYVLDAEISPRQRERLQAQVQTAIRSLPRWTFSVLTNRMNQIGVSGLPLVIEPVRSTGSTLPLGLGEIEGRPAARLRPTVDGQTLEWGQDPRYLVAKAIGYLAAPAAASAFWVGWAAAIEQDCLRRRAGESAAAWYDETDLGLFVEMFAASALRNGHFHWAELPAIHAMLRELRDEAA